VKPGSSGKGRQNRGDCGGGRGGRSGRGDCFDLSVTLLLNDFSLVFSYTP